MAITGIEYVILKQAKDQGILPERPAVLELGEANWYDDVPVDFLIADIAERVTDPGRRNQLTQMVTHLERDKPGLFRFDLAKAFYTAVLDPSELAAIDLSGSATAMALDLNQPLDLGRKYDLLLDFGTAEHVFNVLQFFKTAHELTRAGGVMIHGLPFCGWIDHGFYNFQPTFFFDLAAANNYTLLGLIYAELSPLEIISVPDREAVHRMAAENRLGSNSLLYAVMQQPQALQPFAIPMQGYYADNVSAESKEAWRNLR